MTPSRTAQTPATSGGPVSSRHAAPRSSTVEPSRSTDRRGGRRRRSEQRRRPAEPEASGHAARRGPSASTQRRASGLALGEQDAQRHGGGSRARGSRQTRRSSPNGAGRRSTSACASPGRRCTSRGRTRARGWRGDVDRGEQPDVEPALVEEPADQRQRMARWANRSAWCPFQEAPRRGARHPGSRRCRRAAWARAPPQTAAATSTSR